MSHEDNTCAFVEGVSRALFVSRSSLMGTGGLKSCGQRKPTEGPVLEINLTTGKHTPSAHICTITHSAREKHVIDGGISSLVGSNV